MHNFTKGQPRKDQAGRDLMPTASRAACNETKTRKYDEAFYSFYYDRK